MTPSKPHIPEEQLAALVEGGLSGAEAHTTREHLTGCRTCMAAYVDAVHLREHWRQNSAAPQPVAGESQPSRRSPTRLWLLAASIPLLIIAGALAFLRQSEIILDDLDPAFVLVAAAVDAASHEGMLLPGSAEAAWREERALYRGEENTTGLPEALLTLEFLPAEEIPKTLRYLRAAGELAGDNWEKARILVDNEIKAGSEDPDFLLLRGVLASREKDLAESEQFLNKALDQRADFPEASFNLALVLAETGRPDQARIIFEDLAKLEEYPLLFHRAQGELSDLEK